MAVGLDAPTCTCKRRSDARAANDSHTHSSFMGHGHPMCLLGHAFKTTRGPTRGIHPLGPRFPPRSADGWGPREEGLTGALSLGRTSDSCVWAHATSPQSYGAESSCAPAGCPVGDTNLGVPSAARGPRRLALRPPGVEEQVQEHTRRTREAGRLHIIVGRLACSSQPQGTSSHTSRGIEGMRGRPLSAGRLGLRSPCPRA